MPLPAGLQGVFPFNLYRLTPAQHRAARPQSVLWARSIPVSLGVKVFFEKAIISASLIRKTNKVLGLL
jgi:hypothetical protein